MKTTLERIWERCPHAPTKSTEFKTLIPSLKEFVTWTESNPELFFAIVNSIQVKPVCQFCGKPKTFYNINIGYSNTCGSKSCAAKFSFEVHPELKEIHALNKIGKKLSESTKEKLREKAKSVNSNPSKIERTRQAVQQKYGVCNVFQLQSVKEKSKTTCLKKYGVPCHQQDPEVHDRMMKATHAFKSYVLPSGKTIMVQGYEDRAIDQLLEEGVEEHEMVFVNRDKPTIKYTFHNRMKRYFCDIWIPSRNIVVEVKSNYTWEKDIDLNLAKVKATVSSGFNYRLIMYR